MEMHSVFSDSHPPPHASASLKRMTGVLFSSVCIFFIVVEVKEWVEVMKILLANLQKKQHQVCYLILAKISQLPLQKQPIVSDFAICSLIQWFFLLFFPYRNGWTFALVSLFRVGRNLNYILYRIFNQTLSPTALN